MLEGYEPGTEKRCELLKYCLNAGFDIIRISELVEPMGGKTDEEKEKIAVQLLEKLKKEENPIR